MDESGKKRKIVEIEWLDAQHSTLSSTIDEIENELKPVTTMSVGYLITDAKDYVILGFTDFGEGLIKHFQLIPRGIMKKIIVVRE